MRDAAQNRAKVVAVTVDADDATLDEIVRELKPDMLQLHGHETPERVADVKKRYGLPVIKAFAVREAHDLDAIVPYKGIADRFLLMPNHRKAQTFRVAMVYPLTGHCSTRLTKVSITCFPVD